MRPDLCMHHEPRYIATQQQPANLFVSRPDVSTPWGVARKIADYREDQQTEKADIYTPSQRAGGWAYPEEQTDKWRRRTKRVKEPQDPPRGGERWLLRSLNESTRGSIYQSGHRTRVPCPAVSYTNQPILTISTLSVSKGRAEGLNGTRAMLGNNYSPQNPIPQSQYATAKERNARRLNVSETALLLLRRQHDNEL